MRNLLYSVIVIVLVTVPFAILWSPRATVLRIPVAIFLGGVCLFCVYGFLASNEYADPAKRLPWQIGYGTLGMLSIGQAIALIRRR